MVKVSMSHLLYAGGEASRLRDCELVPCTPKLLQGALPHHLSAGTPAHERIEAKPTDGRRTEARSKNNARAGPPHLRERTRAPDDATPRADTPRGRRGRVVPVASASVRVRLPRRRRRLREDEAEGGGPEDRRGGSEGRARRLGKGPARTEGRHARLSTRPRLPPGAARRDGRESRARPGLPSRPERCALEVPGAGQGPGGGRGARGGDSRAHHARVRRRAAMRGGAPRRARLRRGAAARTTQGGERRGRRPESNNSRVDLVTRARDPIQSKTSTQRRRRRRREMRREMLLEAARGRRLGGRLGRGFRSVHLRQHQPAPGGSDRPPTTLSQLRSHTSTVWRGSRRRERVVATAVPRHGPGRRVYGTADDTPGSRGQTSRGDLRVSVTRRFRQRPSRLGARHVKVRRDDDAGAGLCVQALRGTVRVRTVRVVVAQAGRAEPE